jgi:4-amino-4-deoxy-L-arabinose transferase-like glycosyltransferase
MADTMSSASPSRAPTLQDDSREEPLAGRVLLWMVVAGLALRIVAMLLWRTYHFGRLADDVHTGPNFTFGMETGSIAASLALGRGFSSPFGVATPTGPTAWIGPVYPYFCAALFQLFGIYTTASAIAILSMNSVFAALTTVPLVRLAERSFGRSVALWSGWIWALCPLFYRWPLTWVWETSLSALLATTLFLLALRWRQEDAGKAGRESVVFGATAGFALLTNPALLTIVGIAGLWAIQPRFSQLRSALRSALLSGFVCVAMIAPWLVRNWIVFGQPVFLRSNFWVEFALGNYHLSNGMGWRGKHPTVNVEEFRAYRKLGELGYVASKKRLALDFVRHYPGEFLHLTLIRMRAFWTGEAYQFQLGYAWWRERGFFIFSLLAGLGLWLAMRRHVPASGMFLIAGLLYPMPYYLAFPDPRYRHAIEPIMLAAVAYVLVRVLPRLLLSRTLPMQTGRSDPPSYTSGASQSHV